MIRKMTIFIQWVIFLNLVLAWLRLDLKNYQVGEKGAVLGEAVCFINYDGLMR
jgi:hypothetical protein